MKVITTNPSKDPEAIGKKQCPTPQLAAHRNVNAAAHKDIPGLTLDVVSNFRSGQ